VRHRCIVCGREYPHVFNTFCACGHMIDVQYPLDRARFYDSQDSFVRYFDLLPLERPENLLTYDLGPTPTVLATRLGEHLGLPWLYLKNETVLPTRTTKDRAALTVLAYMRELGVREFASSSTGNSSSALAHFAPLYPECRVYLFAGEDFLCRVNFEPNGQATVFALRGGTFVEASVEAGVFAERRGIVPERGFFNPARREGHKLAYLEAVEAVARPFDWYVQAISSAIGVYGIHKAAKELVKLGRIGRAPRLLCVQQETCSPMARSFEAGSPVLRPQDVVPRPQGIASAILRGDPSRVYPYIRQIVLESGGTIAAVSEAEIRAARRMVEDLEGISPCFTASTAVAGLARLARSGAIPREHTILLNLTGADREPRPPRDVHWLTRTDRGWAPEDPRDAVAMELYEEIA
jgi:threonine synthase